MNKFIIAMVTATLMGCSILSNTLPGTSKVEVPEATVELDPVQAKIQQAEIYVVETRAWLNATYTQIISSVATGIWTNKQAKKPIELAGRVDDYLDIMDGYLNLGNTDGADSTKLIIEKLLIELRKYVATQAIQENK